MCYWLLLLLFLLLGNGVLFAQAVSDTWSVDNAKTIKTWTNELGMKFSLIPKGTFIMGSPDSDPDADANETPAHEVALTKDYYLSQHEVTQELFQRFISETNYKTSRERGNRSETWRNTFTGSRNPVVYVSWNDAQAFVTWLNKREQVKWYRLPTEAEWEYAARARTTTRYYWGDDLVENRANCDGCGSKWDNHSPAPVGSFPPNPWGLYDMLGNVEEWVQDRLEDEFYGRSPKEDPLNDPPDAQAPWVLRGGSWHFPPAKIRAANRVHFVMSHRGAVGFRVARSVE
ncbi:MAG: formylglycine-generating enzyme family protein [Bacteroidetes Order II. Incertae sedis bacterium]|nr:formylglycine-generating enzyme family protein [Bacteroidetes Order II. bacterium]